MHMTRHEFAIDSHSLQSIHALHTHENPSCSTIGSDPLTREVYSYIPTMNADYDPNTLTDDIAVAKLSAFSKYPPLRIQTPELAALGAPGQPVTIVGWGCTVSLCISWSRPIIAPRVIPSDSPFTLHPQQDSGPASPYLRWAETPIEPASVCENAFGAPYYNDQTNVSSRIA